MLRGASRRTLANFPSNAADFADAAGRRLGAPPPLPANDGDATVDFQFRALLSNDQTKSIPAWGLRGRKEWANSLLRRQESDGGAIAQACRE
jgi:hypothetical protein